MIEMGTLIYLAEDIAFVPLIQVSKLFRFKEGERKRKNPMNLNIYIYLYIPL